MTPEQKAALITELEKPAYQDALSEGRNRDLLTMLYTEDPALDKRWLPISVDDFLDVIAGETFDTATEDRVRTYTQGRDTIPVDRPNVRAYLQGILSVDARSALVVLSQRDGRPDDSLHSVTIRDIREAVREMPASFYGLQHTSAMITARGAKTAFIERVGAKLKLIREKMIGDGRGDLFRDFRFAGSKFTNLAEMTVEESAQRYVKDTFAPGGVYAQPNDAERERLVDLVLDQEGLTDG